MHAPHPAPGTSPAPLHASVPHSSCLPWSIIHLSVPPQASYSSSCPSHAPPHACTPLCPMCSLRVLPSPPCTLHSPHYTHKSRLHLCNPQHTPNCTQRALMQHSTSLYPTSFLHSTCFYSRIYNPCMLFFQTISNSLECTNYFWF